MKKDAANYRTEKQKQERKLEVLLLEALESGKATALTKDDFVEIKNRAFARLKAKKETKNKSSWKFR